MDWLSRLQRVAAIDILVKNMAYLLHVRAKNQLVHACTLHKLLRCTALITAAHRHDRPRVSFEGYKQMLLVYNKPAF